MFKKNTPKTTSSTVKIGGQTKAKTVQNANGSSSTNYYMSPSEQSAYEYAQNQFASGLKDVNVFSPQTLKELNDQVEAYKSKGIKQINDIYNPMFNSLQKDVASRFGNLDNSIFLDKLKQIEGSRADSISALSQDIASREQSLKQNELANRYDYLNFLNGYQNQVYQNALGTSNTSADLGSNRSIKEDDNRFGSQLSNMILNTLMTILSS